VDVSEKIRTTVERSESMRRETRIPVLEMPDLPVSPEESRVLEVIGWPSSRSGASTCTQRRLSAMCRELA
jgi:hypothetical protein